MALQPRIRYVPQWDGRMTQVAWYPNDILPYNPIANPLVQQSLNGPYAVWGAGPFVYTSPYVGTPWGNPYYPYGDGLYASAPYRSLVCHGTQCSWETVGLPRHHSHHPHHRNPHRNPKRASARGGMSMEVGDDAASTGVGDVGVIEDDDYEAVAPQAVSPTMTVTPPTLVVDEDEWPLFVH